MKRYGRLFITSFLLIFTLFGSLSAVKADAVSTAKSAALYIPDLGVFAYEKNAHERMRMASTTKIMTALLALEAGDPERIIEVTPETAGVEGSSLYLSAGDSGKLLDFIYAVMLASANDAAETIAVALSGSVEAFAGEMNARAAELGLTDTHFDNPHGLDGDTHYTTAADLAILTAEAMKNPDFAEIAATRKKVITLSEGRVVRTLVNHNRLLAETDFIGVKTGYTKAAGRCLVTAAEKNGVKAIAVTLSCPDDWNAHRELMRRAFDDYRIKTLAKKNEILYTLPAVGTKEGELRITNAHEISSVLPKNSDIVTQTDLPKVFLADVKRGDIVGKVTFYYQNKLISECPLIAEHSLTPMQKPKRFFGLF